MNQRLKKILFNFFISFFILLTITIFIGIDTVSALEDQQSNLIEKISKDFTKKFCNSIGFGLSKESAMKFSFSENKEIFRKRKGFQNIDKNILAEEIANSVIKGCGYQLNLFSDEDVEEFANLYLSLEQDNS